MSDEEIIEQVMSNLDGFDAYNWLAFVNRPVTIDELAEIAACDWSSEATRQTALDCGCIGIALAAAYRVGFADSYHAIADVYKARYGEGFWLKGFSYPVNSPKRAEFYRLVRSALPDVLDTLKKKQPPGKEVV